MTVTGLQTTRRNFFVSLKVSAEFNMKALMKTHPAGLSWSVITATNVLEELSTCVPNELKQLILIQMKL